MVAIVVLEGLAILILAVLVLGLLRSHAQILKSLHELGAGVDPEEPSAVPVQFGAAQSHDVSGQMMDGSTAVLAVGGAQHNTILAFLSTTCVTCLPFWEEFGRSFELPEATRLVIVVQDEEPDKRLSNLAPHGVPVVKSTAAWQSYEIPGSPHFVLVDGPKGRVVGEGTANDWEQVLELLAHGVALAANTNRDDPTLMDQELAAAGIRPGHDSLYRSLDPE